MDWGEREFEKYNAWTGDRWYYLLDFNIVIHNVPVDGRIYFSFGMHEIDNLIFTRHETHDIIGLGNWKLGVYPSKKIGYLFRRLEDFHKYNGIDDPTHLVRFGKSIRISGDGTDSSADVIGTLDFTVDTADAYASNPGIGPKVDGEIKIGSAKKQLGHH